MIKKVGETYVMDEIWRLRRIKYKLKKSKWITLKIKECGFSDDFFPCDNCGGGIITRTHLVGGDHNSWICDECAAKFCPDLLSEAERLREEWDKEVLAEYNKEV